MTNQRRFRFGAQLTGARTREDWLARVRRVEEIGYDSLLMPDHFGDQLAPVPALMAAAEWSSRLRIGGLVLANDFRHPLLLAKEAATLDVLTGGRLELGLGTGYLESDYRQAGLPLDPPAVRIERLAEAITLIKRLFAGGPVSFSGRHYQVEGHEGLPKPLQRPHPPILIAGGGRRVLGIAAREADIVGVNYLNRSGLTTAEHTATASAEATDTKLRWLRQAAGERFGEIELNATIFSAAVTNDRVGHAERLAAERGLAPEVILGSPHFLLGTVDQMVEDLQRRRERWGFSYIIFSRQTVEPLAPVVARLAGT